MPDAENFAATPLFAELFPKPPEHPRLEVIKLPDCPTAAGNWRVGRVENLAAWQTCFSNENLLAALSKYDPILNEITEASHRPKCRFPIRYEDNMEALLPHLASLRNLARVYRLRSLVELNLGQADTAFADVQMCLRLADKIKNQPLLIPHLVQVMMLDLATQPVWEGLFAHRWNDNQLATLQASFENMDQFDCFATAIHGERISACHTIQWLQAHPKEAFGWNVFMREETLWIRLRRRFGVPLVCFFRSKLSVDRFYRETFLSSIDFVHQRVSPKAVAVASDAIPAIVKNPYNAFSGMFIPAIGSAAKKVAFSQTGIQQVTVACALERCRLTKGELPEKLEVLVPEFIAKVPHDVIDGQPLRYRRTAADQFVLYSVGWNEVDDSGQIALTSDQPPRPDFDKGDWV